MMNNILRNYKLETQDIRLGSDYSFAYIERGIHLSPKQLQEFRLVLRKGRFQKKINEIYFSKNRNHSPTPKFGFLNLDNCCAQFLVFYCQL